MIARRLDMCILEWCMSCTWRTRRWWAGAAEFWRLSLFRSRKPRGSCRLTSRGRGCVWRSWKCCWRRRVRPAGRDLTYRHPREHVRKALKMQSAKSKLQNAKCGERQDAAPPELVASCVVEFCKHGGPRSWSLDHVRHWSELMTQMALVFPLASLRTRPAWYGDQRTE